MKPLLKIFNNNIQLFVTMNNITARHKPLDSKYRELKYLLLFTLFSATSIISQSPLDQFSFPSPEASAGGIFNEVPVSLFSGTPNISFPLFQSDEAILNHSISLDYHPASVRPDIHPSWVGMGFHLNAGGQITRKVKGIRDDYLLTYTYQNSNGTQANRSDPLGYFHQDDILDNNSWSSEQSISDFANSREDTEPDEFMFQMNGISGSFYFDETQDIIVVNRPDIKVEVDINPYIEDLPPIYLSTLNGADSFVERFLNYREYFFRGFRITLPDGTQYYFGNYDQSSIDATLHEISTSFFNEVHRFLSIDSWKLHKIIDPNKLDEIHYQYQAGDPILSLTNEVSLDKINATATAVGLFKIFGAGESNSLSSQRRMRGRLIRPTYLSKITSKTYEVDFIRSVSNELKYDYSSIVQDLRVQIGNDYSSNIHAVFPRYWIGADETQSTDYFIERTDVNLNDVLLGPMEISAFYEDYIKSRPGCVIVQDQTTGASYLAESLDFGKLKWHKLDAIKVSTNNRELYTYEFDYVNTSSQRLRLGSIKKVGYDGTEIPSTDFIYEDYGINKQTGSTLKLPPYLSDKIDNQGFFNNRNSRLPNFDANSLQNYKDKRNTDGRYVYSGLLTRIVNPRGGQTDISWEVNSYSKIVRRNQNNGSPFVDDVPNTQTGGVRVKNINYKPNIGEDLSIDYTYEDGILNNDYQYYWDNYSGELETGGTYNSVRFNTSSIIPVSNNSTGNHIGYSKVTETFSDNSYSIHYFSNHENHSDIGGGHIDQNFTNTIDPEKTTYTPLKEVAFERGTLIRKLDFNKDNILVQQTDNTFRETSSIQKKEIKAISKKKLRIATGAFGLEGTAYFINTYPYNNTLVTTKLFDENGSQSESISQSMVYNSYNLPRRRNIINSDGQNFETEFEYTNNYIWNNDIKNRLLEENRLFPIHSYIESVNNVRVKSDNFLYSQVNSSGTVQDANSFNSNLNIILPSRYLRGQFETDYDNINNGGALDIIFRIFSYDLDVAKPKLSKNRGFYNINSTWNDRGQMLSKTQEDHSESMVYDDRYRPISVTFKDGTGMEYDWDDLNRLHSIKDIQKGKLTSFTYGYSKTDETKNFIKTLANYNTLGFNSQSLVDVAFLDGHDREVQLKKVGQGTTDQQSVILSKQYDNRGNINREYEPRIVNNANENYESNYGNNYT